MNQVIVNPNYAGRMADTLRAVNAFLAFFKTPSQFIDADTGEEDAKKIAHWQRLIAETVNGLIDGRLEGETFKPRLKEIMAAVAKAHRTREWPTPHQFEQAAQAVAKRHQVSQPRAQSSGISPDRSIEIWASRMLREEAVADIYIVPPLSTLMIEKFGVSPELIERYQKTLYVDMITLYGKEFGQQRWDDFVAWRAKFIEDPKDETTPAKSDERRKAVAAALQAFQPAR